MQTPNTYRSFTVAPSAVPVDLPAKLAIDTDVVGDLLVVAEDFSILEGAAQFVVAGNPLADRTIRIRGDLIVEDADLCRAFDAAHSKLVLVLDGATTQTVDANATVIRRLKVENEKTVNLVSPAVVLDSMELTAGQLVATGGGALLMAEGTSTPMTYVGPTGFAKRFDAASLGTVTLPIHGAPISFEVTSSSSSPVALESYFMGYRADGHPAHRPCPDPAGKDSLGIHWYLLARNTGAGDGFAGNLVLSYAGVDIPPGVNEETLELRRWTVGEDEWTPVATAIDTTAKTATVTGLNQFSYWVLGEPESPPANVDHWWLF